MGIFFKKLAICILAVLLLLAPSQAYALENGDLDLWESGRPAGYALYVKNADWSLEGNAVRMEVDEKGFALLGQELALTADSYYVLTARVLAQNVAEGPPGVHMGIENQLAVTDAVYETGGEWVTLKLNLRTNGDANQSYVFTVGIGEEDNQCTGVMYVADLALEKVEGFSEGEGYFTLVGDLSKDSDFSPILISSGVIEKKDRIAHEREGISYDHLGAALFATLLCVTFYLAITGKWANRLSRFTGGKLVFYGLLAGAVLLRIYISLKYSGYTEDLAQLKNAAISAFENGLGEFYTSAEFAVYPPLYAFFLNLAGALRHVLSLPLDSTFFGLLLRLPAILSDTLLALLIYKITARKLNKSTAVLLAGIVLFLPVVLFNSAMIAGKGSLFALLALLAVYYLEQDKRVASAAFLTLAFMVNVWALSLVPLYFFVLVRDFVKTGGRKKALIQVLYMLAVSAAVYLLVAFPAKGDNSLLYVFQKCVGGYSAGKYFTFNIASLTGNPPILAGIFGSLSVLAAAVFYFKTKDVFLAASALGMGVLTFARVAGESCIFAACLLIILAANRNSRRLMASALAVCCAGLFNLYGIYAYGPEAVPMLAQYVFAFLGMAAFFYYAFSVLQSTREDSMKVEPTERKGFHKRSREAAIARLAEPLEKEKLIGRWDVLLMLLITVLYGAVAFLNLGSTNIPEEAPVFSEGESAVAVIELEKPSQVGQVKYYTGYCQGKFRVYYSLDGLQYTEVTQGLINHQYRLMFRWEMIEVWSEVKFIKLVYVSGTLEMREMGVFDQENHRLAIQSAELSVNGELLNAGFLIDEQAEIPETTDYMTEMYFDEIYHARTAYEYLHGIYPYEITHPPLGKSIITIGIKLFGFNPFGWRFMGALFGVLMLPVIYAFGKTLLKKKIYAASAAILFAADFMHFSLTRIATIDSYSIFFILLMYLFMYQYTKHNFNKEPLIKGLLPLALSGVFFALGAATKWICVYAGGGLAILFFQSMYSRYKEYEYAKESGMTKITSLYKKKLASTLLFCVIVFILIPVLVYCLSYIPYDNTSENFGLKGILENQKYMLNYHGNLATEKLHSYQSGVYTWPFTIRPVFFFRADGAPEGYAGVLWCMGNPLVWMGGLLAILYLIGMRKNGEGSSKLKGLPFVSVAALMGYLPWMLVTREVFIYHYFAVVPFLILITLYALRHLVENYKWGRTLLYVYLCGAVALFFLFYPANTGMLASKDWLYLIQWYPTWPI